MVTVVTIHYCLCRTTSQHHKERERERVGVKKEKGGRWWPCYFFLLAPVRTGVHAEHLYVYIQRECGRVDGVEERRMGVAGGHAGGQVDEEWPVVRR